MKGNGNNKNLGLLSKTWDVKGDRGGPSILQELFKESLLPLFFSFEGITYKLGMRVAEYIYIDEDRRIIFTPILIHLLPSSRNDRVCS